MPLHDSAREHFDKLTRVYAWLEGEVHKDDLDDFFKTAYHLIENTEKDPATSATQRTAASALLSDPDLELCREITNKQKHYTLDPKRHPNPQIANATIQQGYGVGRFGTGDYGVGEQSVTLNLNDGSTRDAHELAAAIYAKFKTIFP